MSGTPPLIVTASPHLGGRDSTPKIMWNVVFSLLPERLWGPGGALRDGSAAITGILLGLTLPPGIPLWMAFLGGGVGITLG
ncbi:MAG: RnfABCDGE type electron transport complex subunit D, partial [Planctomycetota bacterium]